MKRQSPNGFKRFSIWKSPKLKFLENTKTLTFLTWFTSLALSVLVVGIFIVIIIFAFFSRELPNPDRLLERSSELSTKFLDRNGKLIYELYGDKNRTLIKLSDISPNAWHATLAAEDSDFYSHKGFSIRGMARALVNTYTGEGLQGGSTLTQQVIKNALLTQERTYSRKIKEFILSLQLENKYQKEQILQMYLNESPYGGQNYGIYSAAKTYFNKEPKDLNVAESAYLAGLPQRPSYYSNFGVNPAAGLERKDYVLYLMNVRGWIEDDGKRHFLSKEDYEAAKNEKLNFQQAEIAFSAPHFVFYLKNILIDMFGEDIVESGGLQVTTTIDLDLQQQAEQIVADELEGAKTLNVWNGALVALDPKTGQILTMVGSKGYNLKPEPDGCASGTVGENSCKFDPFVNVVLSERQPGSAIKPITYATMLSQGYAASFPFLDVPTTFLGESADKPYIPANYDGIFRGVVPLRKALGNSLNIPAVKALKIVGIDNMIDQAEKMGISTFRDRSRYGLALTLGGGETKLLELTGAFSVFAAKGAYRRPTPIIEVKDSDNRIVYKYQETGGTQVLDEEVAFLISDILSDDGARSDVFGAGSLLNIPGYQVAAKTGTTDDKRDNYAFGFTPSFTLGVWVGNSNNEKMNPYVASGITGATPIWRKVMQAYLKDKTAEKFTAPSNVKKIEVDRITGMLPVDSGGAKSEWFIQNTEPTAKSDWYQKILICKIDGRIANEGCKNAGETEERNFIKIKAELPEWQGSVDNWVKGSYAKDEIYFPPQMVSRLEFDGDEVSNEDDVNVKIIGLSDGARVYPDFRINVEVSAYQDVEIVRFYMDGDKIGEDQSIPYGYSFSISPDRYGEHEFEVTVTDDEDNKGSSKIRLNVVGFSN